MKLRISGVAIMALFAALLIAVVPAHATAELRLDDGNGHTVDILDGGVGDLCPIANCVTFLGEVGGWDVNVTTGTDKNKSAPNLMHLGSLDHTGGIASGSTILTITWSDNGIFPASHGFTGRFTPSISGAHGTATYAMYEDDTAKFALTNQIGTTLTFHADGSGHTSGFMNAPAGYALTQVVTLTFNGGVGNMGFDATIDPVPEPAGIVFLGTVLLGVTTLIRKKRAA